ncbi:TlpA family protein disulfide reductase [Lacihabitans lacunae]|uniref:TlpA family protein disulfide reductase n=1 Tax=Lacihabitans lacunae TaxID=1028214 RepID=A0ABV7YUC2_9BACT
MLKSFSFLFSFLFFSFNGFCTNTIKGNTYLKETNIQIFLPIENIANRFIPTFFKSDSEGNFEIKFNLQSSNSVDIIIGNIPLTLFLSINENIYIKNNNPSSLEFFGDNFHGNNFFNLNYNIYKNKKFNDLKDNIEIHDFRFNDFLKKQTFWLDSLKSKSLITNEYYTLALNNIQASLLWEYHNLLESNYKNNHALNNEFRSVLNKLDIKNLTKTEAGIMFYSWSYLSYQNKNKLIPDSKKNELLLPDIQYLYFSPENLKKHFWGEALIIYIEMAPLMYDYSKLLTQYRSMFGDNEYSKKMESLLKNNNSPSNNIKIIKETSEDFFSFIQKNFTNQRVYLDLWATWCGPCLLEFSITPPKFKETLSKYKIKQVYFSIDEDNFEKCKKTTEKLNLEGLNFYSNTQLTNSIKEIIYDSESLSIPRYIIIDENGKILSTNAPRPSDPALIQLLKELFP